MGHVRNAVQRDLERDRDLLLNLLSRMTWPLSDDLRVSVGHVWISFNGQPVEGNNSPNKQDDGNAENQDAITQGKVNEVANHFPCPAIAAENSSALVTICWPGLIAPS